MPDDSPWRHARQLFLQYNKNVINWLMFSRVARSSTWPVNKAFVDNSWNSENIKCFCIHGEHMFTHVCARAHGFIHANRRTYRHTLTRKPHISMGITFISIYKYLCMYSKCVCSESVVDKRNVIACVSLYMEVFIM